MQRRQHRVADQPVRIGEHGGQLVAMPLKTDAEKGNVGHAADEPLQRGVAAGLDDLDGFGTRTAHFGAPSFSTVKAPVAVATGRLSSSSQATARTKATDLVTCQHSALAVITCPGVAGRM